MPAALRHRGLRPPGVLAALLAVGALAGVPAPAASDPNGEHAGGGRDAPEQALPGGPSRASAPAAQAAPAPAPAPAPPAPAEARRDRESKDAAPVVAAPQVAATGVVDAPPAASAPAPGASGRSGRGRESSSGRVPRRPAAAPAAAPSASPDPPAPAPATDPSPAPADAAPTALAAQSAPAPAPAAAQPAPSSDAASRRRAADRRAAARRRARARARARAAARAAAARRRAAARSRSGAGREPAPAGATGAPVPPAGGTLTTLAPATRGIGAASTSPEPVRQPAREADDSPIARTVVHVLEVIPLRLRIALVALAVLGVVLGAAALVQARRLRRLERQRGALAADVGVLQSALLPELPERIGGARVTAAYRPAEGLAGGGDFFDGFELPDGRTAVLVGDVAGHGRDVVPDTALIRYSLRAYLEAGLEPRAALAVASDVAGAQLDGRLVTVAVAIFDPASGELTYACAGHWPPALLGAAFTPVLACASPPLGAGVPTGRRQTTVALPPGAAACLHTDGLADVLVGDDRLGMDGLAAELAAAGPDPRAADILGGIVRRSTEQPDDMALCVLAPLPGAVTAPETQLEILEVDLPMLRGSRVERFLQGCGLQAEPLEAALHAAERLSARAGGAVLEVRIGASGPVARVLAAEAPALPVGRPVGGPGGPDPPHASSPPLAAAT